jgi:hypothetical protein
VLLRPPALPLRTTIAARAAVPIEKEMRAAGRLPVERPRPALIGAWAAISPPAAAVRRTATPLSTGALLNSRDLLLGHVLGLQVGLNFPALISVTQ